ncbi:MAG: phosphocholine cytidylyltransferase family protein [Gammaproteobacteria bacterium]|nr:phosphocholine cytidylyltransferase family protein [Gammaproteobacteria bacterium]
MLSAGQGRRLLPLTENQPKCLLPIAGKSVLQWQLDALLDSGIENISVVTGFHSDLVEQLLESEYPKKPGIKILYNPFFSVSDNLASCWQARSHMNNDFLLINGDTVFEADLLKHVLASPSAPITLTIDQKSTYDEDDMKVELEGMQVRHVSKILTTEQSHAESIGMLYFRENGPERFRNSIEKAMRKPAGLKSWFLFVVDALAGENLVQACVISGMRWAEIDFIVDLESAEKLLAD